MALLESVGAFAIGRVRIWYVAMLVVGILSEARKLNVLLLAMLAAMGDDFIRVRANVIALETVEM